MAGWGLVKVALLSDCYLPRLGGIEVQVHDLAAHLLSAGHEVEVFTATDAAGTTDALTNASGGREPVVHRFPLRLPGGAPVNPFAPPEVRRRLAAGGFDVAHVHMGVVSPFAVDMVRVAQGLGLPTAVTWHCVLDRSIPAFRVLGSVRRWAARGAALSAVSSMAAGRVGQLTGGAPVAVLPNGIEVATWAPPAGAATHPETEDTNGPESSVRVVSAMRLVRRKRPLDLIEVLARAQSLVPAGVRIKADIVGDGPQRNAMERHIMQAGLRDVRLHGRVTREALRELHWRSDAYLTSAQLEAFGIAALEARTAGLAVVARRGTGTDDFVRDGIEGALADSDAGLAEALAGLAADPERLAGIKAHNRSTPPTQSWPDVVRATETEYARARELTRSRREDRS